ncbi:hypothetical protein NP493_1551g00040 [Ridgeia piscesae]|uniref:Uncharacterized protein n=1 Tax=Ridgeia piscesae TaxID=27915 RepID=A0AAD9K043_RIDPI|nr:hypothetical protein NP493_1551g00040 [Ridgeia piscesae]
MAKYTEDTKKNTHLHQQMPAQNPTPEVVRQGIQHYILEMNQTTNHRKLNKEDKMEVDTLRKPPETITHQATTWNPPAWKKRRCRPRNTRREMERMATDIKQWRSLVDGLCSQRANRHK